MNLKYTSIIYLLLFSALGFAQSSSVKGKIIDEQNLPIEGVAVVLYDNSKNIISYTVSNQYGIYELEGEFKKSHRLEIIHVSFLRKKHFFTDKNLQQTALTINFTLEENADSLDEVVLTFSNKVKDTVRLDLEKLNLYEDDNLRDILKKIPNFRLSDDGIIIYKGKNIDKILVNNKPSFENQNSIALENIENKIIEGISIINNYNDDFSLDFDENEESVLNIDTKNKNQYIINGSLETKYGYQNKYEFKGKGFLFSQNLNAFLTHNSNNIGKSTIKLREIRKLFSEGQPFSPYQGESLGRLFSRNENLKKDFFTSTNLTLRNQTQRLKTSGLFYYIEPNRINSILKNTSTLDNMPLLNITDETKSKTQSFLGVLSVVYKISDKTIGTYTVNTNYIDNKNTSDIENQLFKNGKQSTINTVFSNNKNNILSAFHQLSVKSKLQKNLILETKVTYYNEGTKLLNDYSITQNSEILLDLQNYKFRKDVAQGNIGLKYKFSDAFIPFLTVDYHNSKEKIEDKKSNLSLVERAQNNYVYNLKIRGRDIFKVLDYEFSTGINPFSTKLNSEMERQNTFIPMTVWVNYEKRLYRYYIRYSRQKRFNELESGIKTIQPFNSIWNGDIAFPLGFNTSDSFTASYNYQNIFDAELFSFSFSYRNQKNMLKRNFIRQQNGILEYKLFVADKSNNFEIASFYSKTVLPLKYPTKIDISAKYQQAKYPTMIFQQKIDVKTNTIIPELRIETITDNFINFSLSSKISFISNEVGNTKYDATYTNSAFSILIKNNQWKGNISFLYDDNKINDTRHHRKNINLGLSYIASKITYSLEARHLGELLGVFKNDSYNSQFIVRDGIASTIINNQSLNYIILGIKFKL